MWYWEVWDTLCQYCYHPVPSVAVGLRPETTSEDIFSACRDGDEFYCREWSLNPENDLNMT